MISSKSNKGVKVISLIFILAILLFYLVWEIYWYTKVGYYFIKWHTHLMPYLYLSFLGYGIFSVLNNVNKKKWIMPLFSIFVFLFTLEFLLLVTGKTKTFSEKTYGQYISPFESSFSQDYYYHIWDHRSPFHQLKTSEFEFTYPTNSLGFPDVEWEKNKRDSNSIRIITLGDSFTEGDGAAYDSNYIAHLKRNLKDDSTNYEILNAGICGGDPVFNFVNLKDRLLDYKPDMVIQMLSSPDIMYDFARRGGLERYSNNQLFKIDPPWWEPIYAVNYSSRILFGLLGFGEHLVKLLKSNAELEAVTESVFREYIQLCKDNNIQLIILIRPEIDEVRQGKYAFDFSPFKTFVSNQSESVIVYDLLPFYQNRLLSTQTEPQEYYWKKDRHHNSKGYKMLADGVYELLMEMKRK